MTAVQITWDEFISHDAERAWTREQFEELSAEQVERVLVGRLRALCRSGYDPAAALFLAVQVETPLG